MKSEYFDILRELRRHHSLFAQFWTVGDLIEIDSPRMPTAGIAFDKAGRGIQFLINPSYWKTLSDVDKAFVIGHECLHVYFDHGRRSLNLDKHLANLAQDVVINHYLVDVFGFNRDELTFGETYCWRDTMFPDRAVDPDRCFEYYYQLLEEQGGAPQDGEGEGGGKGQPRQGQGGGGGKNQTVDIHDFLEEVDQDMLDAIQSAVEDMMDRITPEEVEDFEEIVSKSNNDESDKLRQQQQKMTGTMSGTMQKRIRLGRVIKKRTWENAVANILGRFAGTEKDVDIELWTKPNRRMSSMPSDLMLPACVTETIRVHDRIDVWCFQDTSGSCVDLAERFFKAIATIPDDRFRVRVFCFDTKVYETDLKSGKLYGFGGTSFQPIEDYIQHLINTESKTKYPQAVFLLTDGYGNTVNPQFSERWSWFMTDSYTDNYVPSKSKVYKLADYD